MFNRTSWTILDGVRLKIGSRGGFDPGWLWLGKNSSLQIGKEFSIGAYNVGYHTSISRGGLYVFN